MKTEDTRLLEMYDQWRMSQSVLQHVKLGLQLDGAPQQQVETALENAVMAALLELDESAPVNLFQSLGTDELTVGFDCVGAQSSERAARVASGRIASAIVEHQRVDESLDVQFDTDGLRVAEFEQLMCPALDRLIQVSTTQLGAERAVVAVATSALRYASIFAKTRHIGPPQRVYDDFYDWGVRNEGFASPFNSRLLGKANARFFSAFAGIDGPFGSHGSFFRADWRNHPGAWSIDPPFLNSTLARADRQLKAWRWEGFEEPVLFICPDWYEPEFETDEKVLLEKGTHYYEGLDGGLHPLPVDVAIYRSGALDEFSVDAVRKGYLPHTDSEAA